MKYTTKKPQYQIYFMKFFAKFMPLPKKTRRRSEVPERDEKLKK